MQLTDLFSWHKIIFSPIVLRADMEKGSDKLEINVSTQTNCYLHYMKNHKSEALFIIFSSSSANSLYLLGGVARVTAREV
jgi:hypothetical protein